MRGQWKGALAAWITLVWTTTVVAGIFTGEWTGTQFVTPVMICVTAYYFGTEIADRIRGRGNGNGRANGHNDESKEDRWSHMP